MANLTMQQLAELEMGINILHDKITRSSINYFTLFGISTTATSKEIDAAYQTLCREFPPESIAQITKPDIRNKGNLVLDRIQHAYGILSNYEKRADYEKKGFKDIIEEVEENDVEKAKTFYRKAKILLSQKNYQLAVKVLKDAVNLDKNRTDYILLLGMCQAKVPDFKRDAEANFNKVIELESWNAEPYFQLGLMFQSERLNNKAAYYYRKAIELDDRHAQARKNLQEVGGPGKKSISELITDIARKLLPTLFKKK